MGWLDAPDAATAREHFVYRVFAEDGELLYIGRTKNLDARWYGHHYDRSEWVDLAHHFRLVGPLTYPVAHALEQRLIFTESPRFNQRGKRGIRDPRSYSTHLRAVQS